MDPSCAQKCAQVFMSGVYIFKYYLPPLVGGVFSIFEIKNKKSDDNCYVFIYFTRKFIYFPAFSA